MGVAGRRPGRGVALTGKQQLPLLGPAPPSGQLQRGQWSCPLQHPAAPVTPSPRKGEALAPSLAKRTLGGKAL